MNRKMKKTILCCLVLLCLLCGCQSGGVTMESSSTESTLPSVDDTAVSDTMQREPTEDKEKQTSEVATEQVTKGEPVTVEGLLNSDNITKIYYGSGGTLLIQTSDTLYWYDVDSGKVLAQRQADDWLSVDFYSIEDGFCAVGTLSSGNTGGFITAGNTLCVFYDRALNESETITLNDLGNGAEYIRCAVVSNDGNAIAYSTLDKLYCYDRVSKSLNLVLDLNYDLIENNKGLSSVSALAFSPSEDKLLFCGDTFSLPIVTGQYAYKTYGCIALGGSGFQNLSFQGFTAGSMADAVGGYLFFEEDMMSASGKLAVVNSSDMSQKVYPLSTASEGEIGLFCSQGGEYFATEKLESDHVTIRIYQRDTGKLICTKDIEDTNEEYFYRAPAIYILDDLGICIVKLGGFNDIPSKVVMFSL